VVVVTELGTACWSARGVPAAWTSTSADLLNVAGWRTRGRGRDSVRPKNLAFEPPLLEIENFFSIFSTKRVLFFS
jgi:hypothetical protein